MTRFGNVVKNTRGLISVSALVAITLKVISRNVWFASGSATIVSYAVAAHARTARSAIGHRMRKMLTPHACSATNSRSAERRPSATRIPSSSAMGIVIASACGVRVHRARRIVSHATPFSMSASALRRMGGIIRAKVRMSSEMANGGTISRTR